MSGQLAEKEAAVQMLTTQVAEKEQAVQALSTHVQALSAQVQALSAQVQEIFNSRAGRLIKLLWSVRSRLIPHGSRRERFAQYLMQSLRRIRQ